MQQLDTTRIIGTCDVQGRRLRCFRTPMLMASCECAIAKDQIPGLFRTKIIKTRSSQLILAVHLTDVGNRRSVSRYRVLSLAQMDDDLSFRLRRENDGLVGITLEPCPLRKRGMTCPACRIRSSRVSMRPSMRRKWSRSRKATGRRPSSTERLQFATKDAHFESGW